MTLDDSPVAQARCEAAANVMRTATQVALAPFAHDPDLRAAIICRSFADGPADLLLAALRAAHPGASRTKLTGLALMELSRAFEEARRVDQVSA